MPVRSPVGTPISGPGHFSHSASQLGQLLLHGTRVDRLGSYPLGTEMSELELPSSVSKAHPAFIGLRARRSSSIAADRCPDVVVSAGVVRACAHVRASVQR